MVKPPHRPRGALANPAGRFETTERPAENDGWWQDDDLPPLRTTVTCDTSRSIITKNESPDIPFDRSINPYRGCEHGCVYCYARPTHNYLGLSAGLDFETQLFAKPDAARLLDAELRRPGYHCQPMAIGTNTDPYQPIERDRQIMRALLQVLAAFRHPVTITTKSALVLRDIDILAPMAAQGLARRLEPRAHQPARRLAAIKGLAAAGIPATVMMAPVIPALTDSEMENILSAAAAAGARRAGWILLRLPHQTKELFDQWLTHHRPRQRDHVLSLIRQARGGKLNQSEFGQRFAGGGAYVDMFRQRFRLTCRKLGLNQEQGAGPRTDLFGPPPRRGDQLAFDLAP